MKILYVTAGLPLTRTETFIIPELLELSRLGHQIQIVPIRPLRVEPHPDARQLLPFAIVRPVLSPGIALAAMAQIVFHPLRVAQAALALLGSRSPKVLLKNLAVLPKGLWLAGELSKGGFDHLHVHWASTSATAGYVAARVSGVPWSFTAHRWDIAENNLILEKARTARFARAIDVRGGEELRAHMGPHGHKLQIIHMGVDLPELGGLRGAGPGDAFRVVMAANFVEKKGHRYAIDAVRILSKRGVPIELTCAGDGPLRKACETMVAGGGLSGSVRFLGSVGHGDLLAGMRSGHWDAALLPSIVTSDGEKEGIPVFLMEAMAAGLPVVATDTGGIPELLADGAGLLIPERDPKAIADALEQLHGDAALREATVSKGRQVVVKEFASAASVGRLLELWSG